MNNHLLKPINKVFLLALVLIFSMQACICFAEENAVSMEGTQVRTTTIEPTQLQEVADRIDKEKDINEIYKDKKKIMVGSVTGNIDFGESGNIIITDPETGRVKLFYNKELEKFNTYGWSTSGKVKVITYDGKYRVGSNLDRAKKIRESTYYYRDNYDIYNKENWREIWRVVYAKGGRTVVYNIDLLLSQIGQYTEEVFDNPDLEINKNYVKYIHNIQDHSLRGKIFFYDEKDESEFMRSAGDSPDNKWHYQSGFKDNPRYEKKQVTRDVVYTQLDPLAKGGGTVTVLDPGYKEKEITYVFFSSGKLKNKTINLTGDVSGYAIYEFYDNEANALRFMSLPSQDDTGNIYYTYDESGKLVGTEREERGEERVSE
ncbi:MAG: hypothetical protein HQ594_00735 [Candidatus Omnitrophica bacterium]|nr:hypothetical protein [Candidatus Omnitrophota bacterium]